MHAVLLGRFAVNGRDHLARMIRTPWRISAFADNAPRDEVAAALIDADAAVTMGWDAQRPPTPKLKLLQVSAAGLDRVDLASVPKGLTICNAFGHEDAMGEYALMTMLLWTHQFLPTHETFRGGSWAMGQDAGVPPHGEVAGKTVAIIGTGRIGRAVAQRCKAIGARMIGVNRSPIADTQLYEERLGFDQLDEALSRADFAVVSCALVPETHGLIGAPQLAAMKPTGVIINLARGPVIAEEALYRALADKKIGGAVIDTWYRYPTLEDRNPLPSAFPFHELPNVLMTPHTSAWTTGMLERRWGQIAANLDRIARGEPFINKVVET